MSILWEVTKFIFDVLIIGVVGKLIVMHWLADRVVDLANKWLDAQPQRRAHFDALLHFHRSKTTI